MKKLLLLFSFLSCVLTSCVTPTDVEVVATTSSTPTYYYQDGGVYYIVEYRNAIPYYRYYDNILMSWRWRPVPTHRHHYIYTHRPTYATPYRPSYRHNGFRPGNRPTYRHTPHPSVGNGRPSVTRPSGGSRPSTSRPSYTPSRSSNPNTGGYRGGSRGGRR